MDFTLQTATPADWLNVVLTDFDRFLLDHASCEKKASGMAMSMISHYPDRPLLIREMLDLALEELQHFRKVMCIILERGLQAGPDSRDDYVNQLRAAMDQGSSAYLRDRLLVASIVEARGAERFGLIAAALPPGHMQTFYQGITDSEQRHYQLFLRLAEAHCPGPETEQRLEQLLLLEAAIIEQLPLRPALH
ncbi:MAG: tRNA-(ms[2]io[6]A)-hydroxylase [Pseudomonadales bacterium]|nr:tRNA-(ms[2]io[6]A)-hydroxylase [Pseudomonadales bacterium]